LVPLNQLDANHSIETNLRLLEQGLEHTLQILGSRPILLVGSVPTQKPSSLQCAKREIESQKLSSFQINLDCKSLPADTARERYRTVNELLKRAADKHANVYFIDPQIPLCPKSRCQLVRNNKALYRDESHLSHDGSRILLNFALARLQRG
jgi:hypothetical protein